MARSNPLNQAQKTDRGPLPTAACVLALGFAMARVDPAHAGDCLLDSNNNGFANSGVDSDQFANSNGVDTQLACGRFASATGGNSTAIGAFAQANQSDSIAIGRSSLVGGREGIAISVAAISGTAGGGDGVAIGDGAEVGIGGGDDDIAMAMRFGAFEGAGVCPFSNGPCVDRKAGAITRLSSTCAADDPSYRAVRSMRYGSRLRYRQ